jgi:hypothetical protein
MLHDARPPSSQISSCAQAGDASTTGRTVANAVETRRSMRACRLPLSAIINLAVCGEHRFATIAV